jgi:hypothetical protein
MKIESRYLDGSYLLNNPNWDSDDAPWKAQLVFNLLHQNQIQPSSICEIGCGSGGILKKLHVLYPNIQLTGFDISPQAAKFWEEIALTCKGLRFNLADFHSSNLEHHNVILMLDVFEHVRDPYSFLEETKRHADYFVFHIPLDLSAISVIRSVPLIAARRNVGHLHSFTRELALETLKDCGYQVVMWSYTGAYKLSKNSSFINRIIFVIRYLTGFISKELSVRIFGGETLIVLAR